MSKSKPPEAIFFKKSTIREYFESIVIAVILALFIRTWVVQAFKIPTGSMENSLLVGDHLLVNKFVFGPTVFDAEHTILPNGAVERGDIVVFKFPQDPERDFIKRVIGLPEEWIEVRDKTIYLDGAPLNEPYLPVHMTSLVPGAISIDGRDNHGPVYIPKGHYFVMGDNRDNSEDSRYWGTLALDHIKGKAVVVYWSYDAMGPELFVDPGLSAAIRRVGSVFIHFFTRTRWERMFLPVS